MTAQCSPSLPQPSSGREPDSLEKDHLHFPGGRDKPGGVPASCQPFPSHRTVLASRHIQNPRPSRKQAYLDSVSGLAQSQGQVKPFLSITKWEAEKENGVSYCLLSCYREPFHGHTKSADGKHQHIKLWV